MADKTSKVPEYFPRIAHWFKWESWERALERERILRNEKPLTLGDHITEGECLTYLQPDLEPETDISPNVLFEDGMLLAIEKEPYFPVLPTHKFQKRAYLSALRFRFPEISPCHRLDWETSGVLLLTKTKPYRKMYQMQFQEGQVQKQYIALVHGPPIKPGTVLEHRLGLSQNHDIKTRFEPHPNGRLCRLEIVTSKPLHGYHVLHVKPMTGRTNQIRAQLAANGNPIVGDKKYDPSDDFLTWIVRENRQHHHWSLPTHALHAQSLSLQHKGSTLEIQSEIEILKRWVTLLKR